MELLQLHKTLGLHSIPTKKEVDVATVAAKTHYTNEFIYYLINRDSVRACGAVASCASYISSAPVRGLGRNVFFAIIQLSTREFIY